MFGASPFKKASNMARARKIPGSILTEVEIPKVDRPGRLIELRKGDIRVPQEYQRLLNRAHVRRIIRDFDWFLFGVLIVAYRNGEYFVVDGQHRLAAALQVPEIDTIPCMLYDFNGAEHEADVFIRRGLLVKRLVTDDIHKARLFSGDPVARKAQDLSDSLKSPYVPLATLLALFRRYPDEMDRLAPMLPDYVGEHRVWKDWIEAMVAVEHRLGADHSLTTENRHRLDRLGYARCVVCVQQWLKAHEHLNLTKKGTVAKTTSIDLKAAALEATLGLDGGPGCEITDLFSPREIRDADGNHIADHLSGIA